MLFSMSKKKNKNPSSTPATTSSSSSNTGSSDVSATPPAAATTSTATTATTPTKQEEASSSASLPKSDSSPSKKSTSTSSPSTPKEKLPDASTSPTKKETPKDIDQTMNSTPSKSSSKSPGRKMKSSNEERALSASPATSRKNTARRLSVQLEKRPNKEPEVIASSLAGTAKNLEKKINADQISHLLENRPSKEDLRNAGVLQVNTVRAGTSDLIQNVASNLEAKLKRDQVSHLLSSRPKPEDVKELHLNQNASSSNSASGPVAPALQGRRRSLEFGLTKTQIARQLNSRADYSKLVDDGIIAPNSPTSGPVQPQKQARNNSPNDAKSRFSAERTRIAMALKCASRLHQLGLIDEETKGNFKNLILSDDERVAAVIEVFELDHDIAELMDGMYRIAIIQ